MRLNVVPGALARLAASLTVGLGLMLSPALAGDTALINFLGYSDDGKSFAFEEFGVQDGSGFAYSSIYIIDLPADSWSHGSPFRAMADDETWDKPLSEVRDEAMAAAADALEAAGIDTPVEIMALLGDGVPDTDGKRMEFAEPLCCMPGQMQDGRMALELETFPIKSTDEYCNSVDMNPVGYALIFKGEVDTVELHRDGGTLPQSRGCTLDYRLYAVVEPFETYGSRVAIISSYPFGFEGPDRRFLAVPIDR